LKPLPAGERTQIAHRKIGDADLVEATCRFFAWSSRPEKMACSAIYATPWALLVATMIPASSATRDQRGGDSNGPDLPPARMSGGANLVDELPRIM
jgi:hypothetical protein